MLSDCSKDAPMALYPEWTLEESRTGTGLRWLVGHGRAWPVQDESVEASERCEPALHAPDAGDCRRKQSPTSVTASPSSGCACVAVLRPGRATPARMPTTICVPS